jgi:hypothetical protein
MKGTSHFMTARIGRPPEIPDRVKLEVYLTAREREALARAATQAKVSASAWVRRLILDALPARAGRRHT